MMAVAPKVFGEKFFKVLRNLVGIFAFRKSKSVRNAEYMRINCKSGKVESHGENDGGRLVPDSGKTDKLIKFPRNFASVFGNQNFRTLADICGFILVEAAAVYDVFYIFYRQSRHGKGVRSFFKSMGVTEFTLLSVH